MPALPVQHRLKLAWPQQAGYLLSQWTVASDRQDKSGTGPAYFMLSWLKGWLKGLKGLKPKPFSHFLSENQEE